MYRRAIRKEYEVFDPRYHRRLAAGLEPITEREMGLYWNACAEKVVAGALADRLPDHGGCALLCALGASWREVAREAVRTGDWQFSPLMADFRYKHKMQTASSLLDRVIVQFILGEVGFRIQSERINALCDDALMPIPPAYRFRPPLAPRAYSDWREDIALWRDAERLYGLRGYGYVVKTDIRNCFYSIPRRAVMALLSRDLQDAARLSLIESRLDGPTCYRGARNHLLFGLPVGEPCSHLLANLYLAEFDRWAIQTLRVPHVRYVDDMRFFCRSADEAERVLERVREELAVRFGLLTNDEKCSVEELGGPAENMQEAEQLLIKMKNAICEPLELRSVKFRTIPWAEIIANWSALQEALDAGTLSLGEVEQRINALARLRPCLARQYDQKYFEFMKAVLSKSCEGGSGSSAVRLRLVAIAMGHLVKADAESALPIIESYLEHLDPQISHRAFQWIVWSRASAAQMIAERSILKSAAAGRMDEATERMIIYRSVFGLTSELRESLRSSPEESLRILATAPGGCEETPIDELIGELKDSSPRVRRNAALRMVSREVDAEELRSACRRALAKEEDRDTRLSLLLAFYAADDKLDTRCLPDGCLPTGPLEQAAINGLSSGLVCVDAIRDITYSIRRQLLSEEPGGSQANEVENRGDDSQSLGYKN